MYTDYNPLINLFTLFEVPKPAIDSLLPLSAMISDTSKGLTMWCLTHCLEFLTPLRCWSTGLVVAEGIGSMTEWWVLSSGWRVRLGFINGHPFLWGRGLWTQYGSYWLVASFSLFVLQDGVRVSDVIYGWGLTPVLELMLADLSSSLQLQGSSSSFLMLFLSRFPNLILL